MSNTFHKNYKRKTKTTMKLKQQNIEKTQPLWTSITKYILAKIAIYRKNLNEVNRGDG